MEQTRRTLGLVSCTAGGAYALTLIALALWAGSGSIDAPVRSPVLLLIGAPLLGGALGWTGYALITGSAWARPASTLAAGAAAGLVLTAFVLELTWRWQHPLAPVAGPPLNPWAVVGFLAYPAAQHLLVRVFGAAEPPPAEPGG